MVTRATIFRRIIPACVLAVVLVFNAGLVLLLTQYKEVRVNVHADEHFVSIGELYNNPDNVQKLYDMLLGTEQTKYKQIYKRALTARGTNEFRSGTYLKNAEQNVIVTFGGLQWQVCYLSLTGKEGDEERTPILTLLLSEPQMMSKFQTWAEFDDSDLTYPCNLYGTSYIRAVTLNNGGEYAIGPETLKSATQKTGSPFAIFTMDDVVGSVTDAIVKPREVSWQETQSALESEVFYQNFYNEAWGIPNNNQLEENAVADYANRDGNAAWKDDYLWLPSYTEIGEVYNSGIWKLDHYQLRCGYNYWLRSVFQNTDSTVGATQITKKGYLNNESVHNGGCYVLPALHLNLDALPLRATSTLSGYEKNINIQSDARFVNIGELYNHPENVQKLYDILLGESHVKYQQIYTQAEYVKHSGHFRHKTYDKADNENILVTFGGLQWQVCYLSLTGKNGDAERTPILTLLLLETQAYSMFQTWSGGDDLNSKYQANLYGTSYVRAVTLNNGGQYASSQNTLKIVKQKAENPFAIFTMNDIDGSVTDAIVKPKDVYWQEAQSAIDAKMSEQNLLNEAWSRYQTDCDVWKDDYLWLPSYTELAGQSNDYYKGIWRLLDSQRRCGCNYWLRSALPGVENSSQTMQITKAGELDYQPVDNASSYVLPALHLNLNALSLRASSTIADN